MKLMSMTDFVLEQNKPALTQNMMNKAFNNCVRYSEFLKQPLTLGMFVPCDEDGNIVEEPTETHEVIFHESDYLTEYKESKERVLFKGFKSSYRNTVLSENGSVRFSFVTSICIEDIIKLGLDLTQSAIKQIGL